MQTSVPTPIPFPQQGWGRHRIKPWQRTISLFDWLTRKKKPTLKASPQQKQALLKKFAKD